MLLVITMRSLPVLGILRKMDCFYDCQNVLVVFHRRQMCVPNNYGRSCIETRSLIKDSKTSIKAALVVFSECAVNII
jgi:hypothetical protein